MLEQFHLFEPTRKLTKQSLGNNIDSHALETVLTLNGTQLTQNLLKCNAHYVYLAYIHLTNLISMDCPEYFQNVAIFRESISISIGVNTN